MSEGGPFDGPINGQNGPQPPPAPEHHRLNNSMTNRSQPHAMRDIADPESAEDELRRDQEINRQVSQLLGSDTDEEYDMIEVMSNSRGNSTQNNSQSNSSGHSSANQSPSLPVIRQRTSQSAGGQSSSTPLTASNITTTSRPLLGNDEVSERVDPVAGRNPSSDLNASQQAKVEQFQAFAGIEDVVKARQTLSECGWDVQLAINHILEVEQQQHEPVISQNPSQGPALPGSGPRAGSLSASASNGPPFADIPPIPPPRPSHTFGPEQVRPGVRQRRQRQNSTDYNVNELNGTSSDSSDDDLDIEMLDEELQHHHHRGNNNQGGPPNGNGGGAVSLWSWTGLIQVAFAPIYFIYDSVMSILKFAWSFIRTDPRRNLVDPVADVLGFIQTFEQKYGSRHPTLFPGSYSQAISEARRELRFLLAYLHDESAQPATDNFVQQVLTSQPMMEFISRNNLLVWACSVNLPEGYRVSLQLRERNHPFLALIVLKDGRMTVVGRWELPAITLNSNRLMQSVQSVLSINEPSLVVARAERDELSLNARLRQEQDEAYAASLAADQEKERRRRQEEQERVAAARAKQEEERLVQDMANRLETLRRDMPQHIPPEPSTEAPVRLLLKLPDGTRLERRFSRDDSIAYLYAYVFSQPEAPMKFVIASNFPKRDLPGEPPNAEWAGGAEQIHAEAKKWPSLADAGLSQSEMLFVRDLEA